MRIVLSDFMSLDGVVQAPGGPDEDRDGGFAHGGWSHPFFDAEAMGPVFGAAMRTRPTPCCSAGVPTRAWPRRGPARRATPSPTT